ncbi:uncharacterized protein Dana_GF19683 [Drosophila ananassae]|uniref:BPTI/Kunitz inhibitor domain-containing protein n=1 Tax=Drosophila ananassae TaxID=7217 RepID=B3MP48_DROAN|nr:chymotrypsin inhibitor SCI-III [Drosophila ananassae]EDV31214.1 uncharacterized protein Dana_GF19683 [Drosophila ananassae]KAH8350525.1 hypothetical protein KR067_006166 [Drosophila pandora]KAH8350644.1 hypothetical protein KR067_013460 [Drosophila pandora]
MKFLAVLVLVCCLLGVSLANLKNPICGEEFGTMGKCQGRSQKWTYRRDTNECIQFYYTGCNGNKNNFENKRACEQACKF